MTSKALMPNHPPETRSETELLDFYQRLRLRMSAIAAPRSQDGSFAAAQPWNRLVDSLSLLPDLFHLGVRLVMDPKVPAENKGALLAVLAYVMSPIDLIPDIIPVSGWVDDLIVLVIGLNKFLETDNPAIHAAVQRYWAGAHNVIPLIKHLLDIFDQAVEFLPKKLMRMMKDIFRG